MNPPSILITEDEIMVARDLEQRLHKLGYQVADIVDTGEDAVQKTASLHPDLVLMDIRLSGEMDGIAAAVQIRSAYKTPVVRSSSSRMGAAVSSMGRSRPSLDRRMVSPRKFITSPSRRAHWTGSSMGWRSPA